MTGVWTLEGWLYLAAVLVSTTASWWDQAMDGRMRTELGLAELDMGVGRLHHGERDSQ